MHPAPNLVEAPPSRDETLPGPGQQQQRPKSPGSVATDPGRTPSLTPSSPHPGHNTASSMSSMSPTVTNATSSSTLAATSGETGGGGSGGGSGGNGDGESAYGSTSKGSSSSPTFASSAVFTANDGSDLGAADASAASAVRRPSRRRTGPLSATQREKAALIRKLGACVDCRRRRVACNPSHHNMSWADAVLKFKTASQSPSQEFAQITGRPISPAAQGPRAGGHRPPRSSFGQQSDTQDMDIDMTPTPTPTPTTPHGQQPLPPPPSQQPQPPQQPQQPQQQEVILQHAHEHPHEHAHQQAYPQVHSPSHHAPHAHLHQQAHQLPHAPHQSMSARAPALHTHAMSPLPPPTATLPTSRRLSAGAEARLRTPLPSGRSMDRLASSSSVAPLPGIESLSGELHSAAARIINTANPYRSRYDLVQVLIVLWSSDTDTEVQAAINELDALLFKRYNYTVIIESIPTDTSSPYRWLVQAVTNFVNDHDSRETLKILYYTGHSYLDADREMVLSSSMDKTFASMAIRWSGVQQVLEDAEADVLVLMDAAFYPCSKMARRQGVLEVIAASAGEDPTKALGRAAFTRAVTEELRTRLNQRFRGAFSAAELHVRLMSSYPTIIKERNPDQELITSFPVPLHIQITSNTRLPSILLAPNRKPLPTGSGGSSSGGIGGGIGGGGSSHSHSHSHSPEAGIPGTQLQLVLRLSDGGVDRAGWMEWMRLLPEGVREVKCEPPFRNAYR